MHQLTQHPDQRELLRVNFDEMALTAADEIVRWASPVIHMRRTANEDVQIGTTKIAAGEKVVV
jgi:methyl-branched lipid omega-hydroxylase